MTATLHKMTRHHDPAKFDRYVAQHDRQMTRWRSKGHRDWKDATDEQIRNNAEALARIYDAGATWTKGPAL
jgi:hypothetical protein